MDTFHKQSPINRTHVSPHMIMCKLLKCIRKQIHRNRMDKRFAHFTGQNEKDWFSLNDWHEWWALTQLSHKAECVWAKCFRHFVMYACVHVCEFVYVWRRRMIGKKCLATNSLLAKTCMRVEFNMANYGCKAGGNSDTFNVCPYFLFFRSSILILLSFATYFSCSCFVAFTGD